MAVSADLARPTDRPDVATAEQTTASLTSADFCGLSGWYWYCDEHDAHGIADTEDEAEFVLDAHVEYHELHDGRACAAGGTEVVFYRADAEDARAGKDELKLS